jgi:hypothetical protein
VLLRSKLQHAARVVVLDLHTGLGPRGEDVVFTDAIEGSDRFEALRKRFGIRLFALDAAASGGYEVKGGLPTVVPTLLPHAEVDVLTQEIGTASPPRVLHTMVAENAAWQRGERATDHPARQALWRAFHGVDDAEWQARAVECGARILPQVISLL